MTDGPRQPRCYFRSHLTAPTTTSLISSPLQPSQAHGLLCCLPASAGKDKRHHWGRLPNRRICRALLISKQQSAARASIVPTSLCLPQLSRGHPAPQQHFGASSAARVPTVSRFPTVLSNLVRASKPGATSMTLLH